MTEVYIDKKFSEFHEKKLQFFSVKLINSILKSLGYTALHMAVKEDNEEHCKVLLENGADPNVFGVKSDYFKTPLHRARTQKVVQLLLKYGADPNSRFIYLIDNSI